MTGILYAVPSLLGAGDPADVLPARTLAIARGIEHWIVETPKSARAFLKAIGHPKPIASLAIHALPERPTRAELAALLAPAREGSAVGLVSDAGAPGVADPGAAIVAAAHQAGIRVVPLVGPSSILLALMAFGCSGQAFAFHGYLPVAPADRAERLRALEAESARLARTQLFIETPYRNEAMIRSLADTLAPATRVGVAVDLTLATESVVVLPAVAWRTRDAAAYAKRPAIFALQA
jgi:16S rRNA (cytidine1402-2'-O)-methyltransferase